MKSRKCSGLLIGALLVLLLAGGPFLMGDAVEKVVKKDNAEAKEAAKDKTGEAKAQQDGGQLHYEVTVTATRQKQDTFEIPNPVSVVNQKKIREKAPNNITELLTELPGVDVNGVGANQARPMIRGFRGQRILLMEDGVRMNNSRRQQDFGELPGLVDVSEVAQVEVVRGPASVLYGSDAIGGVVNMITSEPEYDFEGTEIHGSFGYRYSSADKQNKGVASISGHMGKLNFKLSGNLRKADDYQGPSGSFGNITLADDTTVVDSGVKDHGLNFLVSYHFSKKNQLSFKYSNYRAEDTGFGYVDPEVYDPGASRIQILYPMQKYQKYTLRYINRELNFLLADHVNFTAYHNLNQRNLNTDILVPFNNPRMPPGAAINIQTENYTDVSTYGLRLEFNKGFKNQTFTYGIDYYIDRTENTDKSSVVMLGFGPPHPTVDTTPQVPNARYGSLGIFLQDNISLFKKVSLILGMRYQNVRAKTRATEGLEQEPGQSTDNTLVGAANLIYRATDQLRLVFTMGRGFRSPNLIERFFHGYTPDGSAFQSRNTDLKSETSLNFDIGFKYRFKGIYLEGTYFNNTVYDGIRIEKTGAMISNLPEYRNVNVDKLRMYGYELLAGYRFGFGLSFTANYTDIKAKDLTSERPYGGDTYSSKFNFSVHYEHPKKWFRLGYYLRINGDQKDIPLVDNPIGDIVPGFTVHSVSAGVSLFRDSGFPQYLGIIIENLTNTLYSEFSNASFFRPAPKRQVVLTWSMRF